MLQAPTQATANARMNSARIDSAWNDSAGADFWRGIIASAVMLITMRLAEVLFFGPGYFATLAYHPFWIVVLLAAVQHGLYVGVSAAGLATLLAGWSSQPPGIDGMHHLDPAITPTMWLAAALIIGIYRQAQISDARQLAQDNSGLGSANDALAEEVDRLDGLLTHSEMLLATRPEDVHSPAPYRALVDALAQLSAAESAAGTDRGRAFIAAARLCSGAETAWFEASPDGRLVLMAATDPEAGFPPVAVIHEPGAGSEGGGHGGTYRGDGLLTFAPGEGPAPEGRHALYARAPGTGGRAVADAVVALADSEDQLMRLRSTVTLLAWTIACGRESQQAAAESDGRGEAENHD